MQTPLCETQKGMPFESGDPGVLRQAKGQQKRGKGARLARRGAAVKGEGRCPPGSVRQKSKGGKCRRGFCLADKKGQMAGPSGAARQPPEKTARAAPGALPPRGPGALQPEAGACVRLRLNTIGIALTGCAQRRRSAGTAWDARRRCPRRATPSSSARTSRRAPPPPPP